jgi:SAM-dependent methyltransferase
MEEYMRPYNRAKQLDYWNQNASNLSFDCDKFHEEEFSNYVDRQAKILDYGCGYGRILRTLADLGYKNLVGVEPAAGMLERGQRENPDLHMQLLEPGPLPFEDNSFDAVTLHGVLTSVADRGEQAHIMSEIKRVLKPSGTFYLHDFVLSEDERNLKRYEAFDTKYNDFGVFDIEGGAIIRHHDPEYLKDLVANYSEKWSKTFPAKSMLGNTLQAHQFIGHLEESA